MYAWEISKKLHNKIKKEKFELILDIITDASYKNLGIKENFKDWKTQMEKTERGYLVLDK